MPLADAPRVAAGYVSDQLLYGDAVTDLLETVPALAWPQSVVTYAAMRRDPQIQATLLAYTLPLRAATWAVNPAGCRTEVVRHVADAYGMPVLGDDPKEGGPFRRRGVQWDEHLRLALLNLVYGHMPFAIAGEITGTPARWRLNTLSERMPSTLSAINTNDDGTLKEIVQFGAERAIPAGNLLWYVHDREGANWAGTSMLRAAYGPWLIKHEMWRVIATGSRRFGTGTPVVEAPPGATDAQVQMAARLAQSVRVGDQGGAGLPAGFTLKIAGMVGSFPDTLGFVRYLDQQMAQAVLASVLNLDASPNGSRALGETMMGLLRMSWNATAREILYPANQLAARMVDWNFGEDEDVPSLVCTDLDRPEWTAEALKALMDAGAITYDPDLEAAARQRYQMPPRDENYEPPAPPAPAVDPAAVPADPAPGTAGRPPAEPVQPPEPAAVR